jgi:hypothetical protein
VPLAVHKAVETRRENGQLVQTFEIKFHYVYTLRSYSPEFEPQTVGGGT